MQKESKEYANKRVAENISAEVNQLDIAKSREPIIAIDLGSRKIRSIAGLADENGRVEIIGLKETESKGVDRGNIADHDLTVEAILETLSELSLFVGGEIKKALVGISGNYLRRFTFGSGFLRSDPEQPITKEEINNCIRQTIDQIELSPGDRLLHFYPQEFIIDGKSGIDDAIGLKGKEIETDLQIVTGHITNIQNIINCIAKAGLEAGGFIPSYMAAAEAVLREEEKAEGVALLDIGSFATQVAVYHKGFLKYSNIIPFGSAIVTEDIKDGLQISRKEAELLKMKAGSALANKVKENDISTVRLKGEPKEVAVKNLARIIQARMEEILDMVLLEIKNSGLHSELRKGVVLCGGGAQLKNLDQLVNRYTGLAARIGYPVETLVGGMDMEYRNPAYAAAVGLLTKGNEALKSAQAVRN